MSVGENVQKSRFLKVLRMDHAIAENDRTPRETLLQNWLASKRPYGEKSKNSAFSAKFVQNRLAALSSA